MNSDQRLEQITCLLLANRNGNEDWGEISHLDGKPCSKKHANKFLICCLLDYQIDSNLAWGNGYRLVEDILDDPEDVWKAITSFPESEWASRWREYSLHRFPAGHNRLWRIGKVICDKFSGDARHIWEGQESSEVVERLLQIGAGEQISRMIVGALRDCGQVHGASDVKADVYVCRVLGRAVLGNTTDTTTAAKLARQLHPADPWQIDWSLWNVGKAFCAASQPTCTQCYLSAHCAFALRIPVAEVSRDRQRLLVDKVSSQAQRNEIANVSHEEAKAKFAKALSVTTYNSTNPRFLYFEFTKGKYEKVPFAVYAPWIEKIPKVCTYPEWRLKQLTGDSELGSD